MCIAQGTCHKHKTVKIVSGNIFVALTRVAAASCVSKAAHFLVAGEGRGKVVAVQEEVGAEMLQTHCEATLHWHAEVSE